jgi:hypothetical protein
MPGGVAGEQLTLPPMPIKMSYMRIPVMWATDSGDVGQGRSEATLVVFLH